MNQAAAMAVLSVVAKIELVAPRPGARVLISGV